MVLWLNPATKYLGSRMVTTDLAAEGTGWGVYEIKRGAKKSSEGLLVLKRKVVCLDF